MLDLGSPDVSPQPVNALIKILSKFGHLSPMTLWTCKRCGRRFGNPGQAHGCIPGCSVDQTFAARPPVQRRIYDRLISHLKRLGPVHEDAVFVGVFVKRGRKLAEVRPMAKSLHLWLILPVELEHPKIARRAAISSERFAHLIKLKELGDVDADLKKWLALAFHASGAASPSSPR
jgi:hypothetical protein